jgi:hypothetical protein
MSTQQIALFIAAGVAIWIYMDAKKNNYSTPASIGWMLGVFILMIIFLPIYLVMKAKRAKRPVISTSSEHNINNTGVYDGSISCIKCGTLCGHGSHSTGRWVAIGLLSFFLFPFGLFSFFLLRGRKNYRCLKCGTQFRM